MDKQDRLRRLKSIEGHVRGVTRMVEEDAYCIDIIRQIQAIQAALGKLGTSILDDHLQTCVAAALHKKSSKDRERMLQEIAEVYAAAVKV